MNLKEAFRYQNYLESMLNNIELYLGNNSNITRIQETHFRNKSNPDAQNETKDTTPARLFNCPVLKLVDYMLTVAEEKIKLTKAINEAKQSYTSMSYDVALMCNNIRQQTARVLRSMANVKATENQTAATDYKFNVNGEQVAYRYEMTVVRTIDFDRNKIRKLFKRCNDTSDETSNKLDEALLNINVMFEPKFDLNNSFEESVEDYINQKELVGEGE